jgi:hypothetical protein
MVSLLAKGSSTLHMLLKGVTVGPVVLLGITEVSGRDVDELDVVIIDVVAVSPGGGPLFSNVCDAAAMVARVCWKW